MVQALGGLSDHWWVMVLTALLAVAVLLLVFHLFRLRRLRSLLVSERRLKDLMDRSPLGIVVYRDRTLLYANALSLSLFGMPSLEEMGRKHFMEFFAPEERARILGYIVAREKGEPAPTGYEVMALKAGGQPFPLAVQVSQVDLRDGPAVIMFLEDASERRAARAALEKSERDYRGLFENAHDAILIFEPEGERILDANERASEMYGVPREELLGQSLEAFSANVAEGKRRIEEIVSNGVLTGYQTAHRRKDGSLILLDVNASMVDYGGRRAILSIQRDITDRVRAEEALRESEEEYRLLVESQTDIVVKLTPSARLTYASPSFCRTFGRSLEELVGNEVGPLIHEEDRQQTLRAFAALKNPPHRGAVEHRLRTKDGWRWFSCSYSGLLDDAGDLSGIIGTGQDVTERKAAEDALRESEQRFRALTDSSTASILIYQDAKILYVNRSMETLLGYKPSELLGTDFGGVLHPDYRDLLLKRAHARQRGEPVLSQYEAPLMRKDGTTRWLLISAARILYQGEPAGILAAFDVTEKRDAEERLRQSAHEIRAIFSALPDLYFRLDQEGRILDWRAGHEQDLYLKPEQIQGKLIQEALPPETAAPLHRALKKVLESRKIEVVEYALPIGGEPQTFEAHLAPLFHNQAVAVVRNITERQRAQSEIEAWKRRFDLVSAASGQVVYDYDVPSGAILWSGSVEQVLGYDPAEMGNLEAWSERVHPEDRAEALRLLGESERACAPYDVDYRFQHKGGYFLRVHDRGFFIKGASGRAERMVGMMADVTEVHRAQEAMRRSEERFRRTFDLSPVGAVMVSLEGQFLRCNQAFCAFLGYREEDLAGKHFLDVTHPDDAEASKGQVRSIAERGLEKGWLEKRYLRKDGSVVWGDVTIRLVPETADYPPHFLTTIVDITERKRAGEVLAASETKFRNLYEQMRDGFVVVTLEGRILECNEAYCALTGYTREELVHLTYMDLTPERWHEMERRHLEEEILEFGASSLYEKEYRRKDGSIVPIEVRAQVGRSPHGKPLFMWAIVRDITERKGAEQRQRETTQLLTEAQRLAALGWYVLDVPDGRWKCSPLLEDIFGISGLEHPKTVEGWLQIIHPDDREAMWNYFENHVVKSGNAFDREYRILRPCDGEVRWVHGRGEVSFDAEGRPLKMVGAIQDITAQKEAEEALGKSEKRLRLIYENVRDIIYYNAMEGDPPRLKSIAVSPRVTEMLGYDQEDFNEDLDLWFSCLHPEDGPAIQAHIERLLHEPGPATVEYRFRRKDTGEYRWMEDTSVPDIGPDGRRVGFFGVVRDVTERKRAEAAVAASEARLRLIVENVQEIIYSVTFDHGPLSSTTSFVSPQVVGLIGYTPQEFYDAPGLFVSILHPEDEAEVGRLMDRFIADGEGGTRQYRLRHKTTGEYRWMEDRVVLIKDAEGAVVGFQGVARDVTERKRAEAALLESEGRLRKILEQSPISMALVGMDGTIEYINRKAIETFGYLPRDIPTMDRWWIQAYPDEEYRAEVVATWMGLVQAAIAENHEIEGREYRVTCKDGTEKIMFIFGVPVAEKVFVMFQDVTDRALAREALQARLEQHRALVENARAIILQWDPDLKVTFWNDFATEFFGYSREEILGASLLDTIVPRTETSGRDLEVMIRDIAVDVNRFAANINENLTKDRRRVWVAWTNRPMVDAEGRLTGILSVGTDVTELKRAEGALAESEKRLRVIYDNVQEIVYYLKPGSGAAPVAPSFVNRQIETLLGYTVEEYLQGFEAWKTVIHPEDFERLAQGARTLLSDPRPRSREFRVLHKLTGEYHWIENMVLPDLDASGRPQGYFGVARDVTERRRSEDLLRLRNRQLMAVAVSADAMGRFLDTQRATQAICDAAIDAFGATMAWVGLVVPESTEITPLSSAGKDEGYTGWVKVRWDLSERSMGPTGRAVKTRKPQIMHVSEPSFAPWREEATRRGYLTVCAVPILHGEEVRGVITIYSDKPDAFGPEIFDIFEVFARQCAMVLVNAALYEEARNTIQELWALNEQLKGKS
jgi:PAS domain S-box-containing protein